MLVDRGPRPRRAALALSATDARREEGARARSVRDAGDGGGRWRWVQGEVRVRVRVEGLGRTKDRGVRSRDASGLMRTATGNLMRMRRNERRPPTADRSGPQVEFVLRITHWHIRHTAPRHFAACQVMAREEATRIDLIHARTFPSITGTHLRGDSHILALASSS